ncbi:hypothetical protein [Mesorhizobium sp.]|uniref:hypothetical protein n=1 Tax=Mesorhizobium sp. TaxID=1871066 RepID=UPI000FEA2B9A|nr:hypothetical protein [Mesorhizobium sp.]RWF64854.1 MAG: hypothetical protein EOS47_13040 [Mesorhizobium sp.]
MARDKTAVEQQKLEKTIQRIVTDIAELHHDLRNAPMWPDQVDRLKKAIFDLEERIANDTGLMNQLNLSNR